MIVCGKSQLDHMTCLCFTISVIFVSIVSWAIEGHSAQGREMIAITLSTLSINPTERGHPRPGKPGFGIIGDQHAREVHTFLLLQSFQKSPSGLQQLRQFTLYALIADSSEPRSLCHLLDSFVGNLISIITSIYCSNTKSGWVCLYLQSQSLLVCLFLIPKR